MHDFEEPKLTASTADVRQYRGWFLALGLLLVGLGFLAILADFATTLATVLLFGVLLLVAGVVQIVHALSNARWGGFAGHLLGGILYAVIGGTIVFDPVAGAIGLTFLLAIFFVAGGIFKVLLGVQAESGWSAFGGLIDFLLGFLIWVGWPKTAIWVIGLFVGIELLLAGLNLILLASAANRPPQMKV